jgi:hypothetical protein
MCLGIHEQRPAIKLNKTRYAFGKELLALLNGKSLIDPVLTEIAGNI